MTVAAVAIDEHRVRAVEGVVVFGPAIEADFGLEAGDLVEALLEQQAAGFELMFTRP